MDCPRCRSALEALTLCEHQVWLCRTCEGGWYPDEALAAVTDLSFAELAKSELGRSLEGSPPPSEGGGEAACPQCGATLLSYRYTAACEVELHECPSHGVWLDDGELGGLVSYLEDLQRRVEKRTERIASEVGSSDGVLAQLSDQGDSELSQQLLGLLQSLHAQTRGRRAR